MSSTNVPNFKIINHTEVGVAENGTTIPRDLNEKYYGNNLEMGQAIESESFVSIETVNYKKYKGEKVTILIDENGKIQGNLSKLSKAELAEIAKEHPEVLKASMEKEESR